MKKYRNPHGQLKDNLFLSLFNTNFISKFEINAGITDFSTTGPAGLERCNNGRRRHIHDEIIEMFVCFRQHICTGWRGLLKNTDILSQAFYSSFRYIDYVLSLNNSLII